MQALQTYHYSFFERLWLKIELQSANKSTEKILNLVPVLLFMQKDRLDVLLENLETHLHAYLKPHLIHRAKSYIILKLKEFNKNEQSFIQARGKAFECLAEEIQLYGIVLDLFEGASEHHSLDLIEQIVRKKFDKDYVLNKTSLRLLAYQEKYVEKYVEKSPEKLLEKS